MGEGVSVGGVGVSVGRDVGEGVSVGGVGVSKGVTPIDIVTAATAGQSFDRCFQSFDR